MSDKSIFLEKSDAKSLDLKHRNTIKFNIGKYNNAVDNGSHNYQNHELGREKASYLKGQAIYNLDKYLIEFENNFTKNGGKVLWAENAKEAIDQIHQIVEKNKVKSVVKSKSMTTEEIHLNEFLEKIGVETVETDLGEYIVQLAGEAPYHIVTPAMHKSKKDIAELFHEKLKIPLTDDAKELTLTARKLLREKYLQADLGITGANFILPDIGGIAVTENEGNARMSTAFPKIHIAIVGIEKVIPSYKDLNLFWPMLAQSGTGQQITVYSNIFTGPKQAKEEDGPEQMYVILLDNGRTDLLQKPEKIEALKCIRCGACLNTCPVYKTVGGHTYGATYSGPIGSVITPHFKGMEEFVHLSQASSLCGSCTSVCPVKIPIHNLLLLNRQENVKNGGAEKSEELMMKMWKYSMKRRWTMNMVSGKMKQAVLGKIFSAAWGDKRNFPDIPPKSFNQLWKDRK